MNEVLLKLEGLEVWRGGRPVLRTLDLSLMDGETVALLGPSGCGKTTLLLAITGLLEPEARVNGRLSYRGAALDGIAAHRRGIPLVLQDLGLFEHMSVLGNVAYPLRLRGIARGEAEERARAALAEQGMGDLTREKPGRLSGGQRQRVALARALVTEAPLLLLDEPTSALDARTTGRFVETLRNLRRRHRAGLLIATHDRSLAAQAADRIAILDEGRLIQFGPPEELHRRPRSPTVARLLGHHNLVRYEPREGGVVLAGQWQIPGVAAAGKGWALLPEDLLEFRPQAGAVPCRIARTLWREGVPLAELRLEGLDEPLYVRPNGTWPPGQRGFLHIDLEYIHYMEDSP